MIVWTVYTLRPGVAGKQDTTSFIHRKTALKWAQRFPPELCARVVRQWADGRTAQVLQNLGEPIEARHYAALFAAPRRPHGPQGPRADRKIPPRIQRYLKIFEKRKPDGTI